MARPVKSIRRLLRTIVSAFVDAARQGARCSAVFTASGVIEHIDEDEVGVTAQPRHSAVREIVDAGIAAGSDSLEEQAADYKLWIKIEVG